MRKFPRTEPEIITLAQQMAAGLDVDALVFPASPVAFDAINDKVTALIGARQAMVAAKTTSTAATTAKDAVLTDLVDSMKQVLRYAENIPGYSNDELGKIGWSERGSVTELEAPGQPPLLTVTGEGPGDISLDWQKPASGGQPSSYRIERREPGTETWNLAEVSPVNTITLTQQPRSQSLEYRVVAMNRVGQSPASNTVSVVL